MQEKIEEPKDAEEMEKTQDGKPESEELGFEELKGEIKEEEDKREKNYEKASQLEPKDQGKKCRVKKIFKFKSKFPDQEYYYSVLLTMLDDNSERWKTLNGWDKELILKSKPDSTFKIGIEKYKGNLKLVLKPEGEDTSSSSGKDGHDPVL